MQTTLKTSLVALAALAVGIALCVLMGHSAPSERQANSIVGVTGHSAGGRHIAVLWQHDPQAHRLYPIASGTSGGAGAAGAPEHELNMMAQQDAAADRADEGRRRDLAGFFSDESNEDAYLSELSGDEKEINNAIAEAIAKAGQVDAHAAACARIGYEDRCGFAGSGYEAFVINERNDRRVRATVRVSWRRGIDSGEYDQEHTLPAGGKKFLGCTRSNNIPVTDYSFRVVGCEVLR